MNVEIKKSVYKDVAKIPNNIKVLAFESIEDLENAESISDINNVRTMEGTEVNYFRLKLRNYRMLIHYDKQMKTITVEAITHRKDAYKKENLPWRK